MLARLKRGASDSALFVLDRRYRQFRRQRTIVGPGARDAAAQGIARKLPKTEGAPDLSADPNLLELSDKGWLSLDSLITPAQAADMLAYAKSKLAYDPYRQRKRFFAVPDQIPADTHVAHHSERDVAMAPHAMQIANDPRILALVEAYLGAKPTISSMRMWWSSPTPSGEAANAELFHRDVDDLRFLKLFVYLTDVTADNGPHLFVEGSQVSEELTNIRRFSDEEVAATFGTDAQRIMTGPAGTAFIENTYGIHRGIPPARSPRLLFQVEYSLQPLIYGPRRPVARSEEIPFELDPYVNRVIVS